MQKQVNTVGDNNNQPIWMRTLDLVRELAFKDEAGNGFLIPIRQILSTPLPNGVFADLGIMTVQVKAPCVDRAILAAHVETLARARAVKALLASFGEAVEWPENVAPLMQASNVWRAPRLPHGFVASMSKEDALEMWNAMEHDLSQLTIIDKDKMATAVALRGDGRAAYWAAAHANGRTKPTFMTLASASMSPDTTELVRTATAPFRLMVLEAKIEDGFLRWQHSASVPTMHNAGVMVAPPKWLDADGKKLPAPANIQGFPSLVVGGACMPLISRTTAHGLRLAPKSAEALSIGSLPGSDIVSILGLFLDDFQPRYDRVKRSFTQVGRGEAKKRLLQLKLKSAEAQDIVELLVSALSETAGLSLTQRYASLDGNSAPTKPWMRPEIMRIAVNPTKLVDESATQHIVISLISLFLGERNPNLRASVSSIAGFCNDPEHAQELLLLLVGEYPREQQVKVPQLSHEAAYNIADLWDGIASATDEAQNPDATLEQRHGATSHEDRAINRVSVRGLSSDVLGLMMLGHDEEEETGETAQSAEGGGLYAGMEADAAFSELPVEELNEEIPVVQHRGEDLEQPAETPAVEEEEAPKKVKRAPRKKVNADV